MPAPDPELAIPAYWLRPPQTVSQQPGVHRFVWDLHYPPVPGIKPDYPIAAVYHNTAPSPTSPWVMPGRYLVVLTVGNQKYEQTLNVQMDPRVKTPPADLQKQFDLSQQLYQDLLQVPIRRCESHCRTRCTPLHRRNLKWSERNPATDAALQQLDGLLGAKKAVAVAAPTPRR